MRKLLVKRQIVKQNVLLALIDKLKPGDIILTSRKSIIVKFMALFQKDPVRYGHAMIVRDVHSVYEAHFQIEVNPLIEVFKKRKYYTILRFKKLEPKHVIVMNRSLDKIVGEFYSVKRIGLQFLDHIFNTNWFSGLDTNTKSQVCSSLVAWAYYVALKYKFNNVSWKSADPDDIEDDFLVNPENWELIVEK